MRRRFGWMIALFLMFTVIRVCSQSLTAGLNVGMGSYTMNTLRELQGFRMEYAGLPAQVTENFPVHWNGGVEFGLCFPKFPSRLVLFYQFSSTGARVSSKDYSGELKLDLVANCRQIGLGLEQDMVHYKFFALSGCAKFSYLFTEIMTLDFLRINDQASREEYRFTSGGAGLEPGILAGFNLLFFRIGLYGGYLFSFSEGLHLQGNSKAFLKLPNDKDAVAEWNGWRAGVKLDFRIPLKKKQDKKS